MPRTEIAVKRTGSIVDDILQHEEMIRRRAFDIFQTHLSAPFTEVDDWLSAEREVSVWPSIDLRQEEGRFEIDAALPGVDPKNLEVKVTNEDVLITAERDGKASKGNATGTASGSENVVRMFGAIHLPAPIDPDKVKAEYRQGLLHLTAALAKSEPKKIEVGV
jgi:HSP20 family protein